MKLNTEFVLVDTSAWIEYFRIRGNAEMRELIITLLTQGEAAWCEIVRLELWNGARGQQEIAALERVDLAAVLLPITAEVWRVADRMARSSRLAGKTFPTSDLLIGACARFHGAKLVHKDKHFDQLKAL